MQIVQFLIHEWLKILGIVTPMAGAIIWLATSLWKLSAAVARFEITVEDFKKTQVEMLEAQREDRGLIHQLQIAIAKLHTIIKVRNLDRDKDEAGSL